MSISEDGELKIQAAKKITITHGDADEELNSISLDPTNGVEIKSKVGLKVNGKKLVNEGLVDWLVQNLPLLYMQTVPPSTPTIINPATFPLFAVTSMLPDDAGGYKTASVPVPATGIISQPDDRMTIA
jgi:hypothetical protein